MTEFQRANIDSEVLSDIDDNDSMADTLLDDEGTTPDQVIRSSGWQSTEISRSSRAVQAAKAIDAAQDRTPWPDQILRDTNLSSDRAQYPLRDHEETLLLDAGPAPPDYAAATAWRRGQPTNTDDGVPPAGDYSGRSLSDTQSSTETARQAQPPSRFQQYRDDIEQASQPTRTRIERYQDDIERGQPSYAPQRHDSSEDIPKREGSVLQWILATLFNLVYRTLSVVYQTLRYLVPKLCRGAYVGLKWCFETRAKAIATIVVAVLVIVLPILFDDSS